ncbi:MAG: chorismate synthase [Sulfolobales archaeon]|nr:chorismate synthase [Sulfolobales archaeon]MCG2893383.1 chorismate synthase [Sulfolobales archaeon]MCG2910600.1 chorismate synthase [Sulfolobales archaeon]
MPGNSFGERLRITTFGESHGPYVGVVIDGLPAGLPLSKEDLEFELQFRRPGRQYVTGRREKDEPEIISGIYEGRTTGAPVTVIFKNTDVISSFYEEIHYKPRPGHADLPYILKYGFDNWDYRGGGRASARETVARVAAGAVAKKLLMMTGTWIAGYLTAIGKVDAKAASFEEALCSRYSPVRAPNKEAERLYEEEVSTAFKEGDSVGGVAEIIVRNPPIGLGEPVFDKLKADLAKALLSIPAVVGFEYGLGFQAARMRGSEVNDEIVYEGGRFRWRKNTAGGILGGLSNGEDIVLRVAFKPTSSIRKPQRTVDLRTLQPAELSVVGRHDPSVAIRGVAVAESMTALVLADHAIRAGVIPSVRLEKDQVGRIEEEWKRYKSACLPSAESQQ